MPSPLTTTLLVIGAVLICALPLAGQVVGGVLLLLALLNEIAQFLLTPSDAE